MFNWLFQADYESRKVDRYDDPSGFFVSTAFCEDNPPGTPFETGIRDKRYHHSVIIVETYKTREAAQAGHNRWVKTMLENPPVELVEVGKNDIAKLCEAFNGVSRYQRQY